MSEEEDWNNEEEEIVILEEEENEHVSKKEFDELKKRVAELEACENKE